MAIAPAMPRKRRGRQVVAGDRDAVLPAGEGGAAGVHVRRALVGLAGPEDEGQRDGDEGREDGEVEQRAADLLGGAAAAANVIIAGLPFHVLTDARGGRVEYPFGIADVERRHTERRDELQQPHDQADVELPRTCRAHEVRRVGGEEDVQEVPEQGNAVTGMTKPR